MYFADYHAAYDAAVEQARKLRMDVGLEKWNSPLTPGMRFRTFLLPKPSHRQGFETRCEVVTPDCPRIGR